MSTTSQATPNTPVRPKMPKGISYIIGNEAAERFSYYGMRTILYIFMTRYLMTSAGSEDFMSPAQATTWYHTFMFSTYFFPFIGALISDIFWGKYKTILRLSIVYCLGHLCLAFMDLSFATALLEPRVWLALGLGFIAMGSGGIKPCVSAHVGDQFSNKQQDLLGKVFGYFYFAINFGATLSTFLSPWTLKYVGPSVAFGIPGILMLIATIIFYMGRKEFIAMPPAGWKQYKKDAFGPKGIKAILNLSVLYFFISFFWALYEQTGSRWVEQAEHMNRTINLGFYKFEILASQMQAVNPILVMLLIPVFTLGIYPWAEKYVKVTSLRKIGVGFFITAFSFVITALLESFIQAGQNPSIMWQVLTYTILTCAEVMIYLTALEFSYTQAPNSMKSLIMGFFMLSISLGNAITALVNVFIQRADGTVILDGPSYYLFFAGLLTFTSIIYVFVARVYQEENYLQDHSEAIIEV